MLETVLGIDWLGLSHPGTYTRKSRIAKDLFDGVTFVTGPSLTSLPPTVPPPKISVGSLRALPVLNVRHRQAYGPGRNHQADRARRKTSPEREDRRRTGGVPASSRRRSDQ